MAYTLSNKCAKNLCKRTVPLQFIIKNVVTCFLEHSACTVVVITSISLWCSIPLFKENNTIIAYILLLYTCAFSTCLVKV